MGNNVEYCLNISGGNFNSLLPARVALSNEEFQEYLKNDLRLEADLVGIETIIEISGEVTLVWTPWKYTNLINNKSVESEILEWENYIRKMAEGIDIFRIDEFLLNEWSNCSGEYWFRDGQVCHKFFDWVKHQDPLHWQKIT
jgi:hypothetical protein